MSATFCIIEDSHQLHVPLKKRPLTELTIPSSNNFPLVRAMKTRHCNNALVLRKAKERTGILSDRDVCSDDAPTSGPLVHPYGLHVWVGVM
jgi:hypothetical protein